MINVLHLGLSYACNLKCNHCFVDKSKDELSYKDYTEIIDTLYKEGLFVVIYTYGEPLMSNNFFSVSQYVRDKGISQVLMTNGTLVTAEIARKIKECNVNKVYVSIDHSIPRNHDKNRGCKGTFQKAVQAIKILQNNDINVGIATTITNDNLDCLKEIYILAKEINVRNISFLRERENFKIIKLKDEEIYFDFFKEIIQDKTINVNFHDKRLKPVVDYLHNERRIDDEQRDYLYSMFSCKNCYTLCVQPDGRMSRCNFINPLKKKYKECNFKEYIKSEEFKSENSICYS